MKTWEIYDTVDDRAEISVDSGNVELELEMFDAGVSVIHRYTPQQARDLAFKLFMAANKAEGV